MTPTERGILRDVIENPGDDLPRLVYADWCDDNDLPERAEFIRLQLRTHGRHACWETPDGVRCDAEMKPAEALDVGNFEAPYSPAFPQLHSYPPSVSLRVYNPLPPGVQHLTPTDYVKLRVPAQGATWTADCLIVRTEWESNEAARSQRLTLELSLVDEVPHGWFPAEDLGRRHQLCPLAWPSIPRPRFGGLWPHAERGHGRNTFRFSRGFIDAAECRLDYWLKRGRWVCERHPVRSVAVIGKFSVRAGFNGHWHGWGVEDIGDSFANSSNLPAEIHRHLKHTKAGSGFAGYANAEEANAALSDACVAWARS